MATKHPIGKWIGISVTKSRGSDGNTYLSAVIWMPRSFKRRLLRYFYPSIRWFA